MKIIKVVFLLRVLLLTITCFLLVNGKQFIEAGLIALFILYDLTNSKLKRIEKRLDDLENEK